VPQCPHIHAKETRVCKAYGAKVVCEIGGSRLASFGTIGAVLGRGAAEALAVELLLFCRDFGRVAVSLVPIAVAVDDACVMHRIPMFHASYTNVSYPNLSFTNLSYMNVSFTNVSYMNVSYMNVSFTNVSYMNVSLPILHI